MKDSENSVHIMEEVQEIMNEQQEKLQATRRQFMEVGDGIGGAAQAAGMIRQQTEHCNTARANVADVISNLVLQSLKRMQHPQRRPQLLCRR